MIHRLAAIKLIRELELDDSAFQFQFQGLTDVSNPEDSLKKEIIEISCQNGTYSTINFVYLAIHILINFRTNLFNW